MPRIIEETHVKLGWQDLDNMVVHPRPQWKRKPGVHVSGILRYVAGELGLMKDWPVEENADDMPLGVLLGMAWEEQAARLYPTMRWQPEPLEKDGVIGSPDGLDVYVDWDTGEPRSLPLIDEFKRTLKSRHTSGDITRNWLWMAQVMAYMAMDSRQPQLARFHVDWDAGDYRPPRAEYWRYIVKFERREIAATWRMIEQYKHVAVVEAGA